MKYDGDKVEAQFAPVLDDADILLLFKNILHKYGTQNAD